MIYRLEVICGPNYPVEPPSIKFMSEIKMIGVDDAKNVTPLACPILKKWKETCSIKDALNDIRE